MLKLALFLIAFISAIVYYITDRILSLWNISSKFRIIRIVLSIIIGYFCVNWTAALIVLHLAAAFLITDIAAVILKKLIKVRKKTISIIYRSCAVPVLMTTFIMIFGFYNIKHIVKTEYTTASTKLKNDYEIVLITDTHYGTIQSKNVIKSAIQEISESNPDIVLLGGDIVEEGTSKEDMLEIFDMLGSINNKYGVYYVYGNHDRQTYTNNNSYTEQELTQTIRSSGINILSDKTIAICDDIIIAGREDASMNRLSAEELLKNSDRAHFIMMLDHQPVETEISDSLGVDLELSGHTHAGQIFPVGYILELAGRLSYGEYQIGNCKAIVSSGAAGWGFPVRTQERCEYVVIHLKKAKT